MSNRLSHSQSGVFQRCPQSWKYSYVDRLRPKLQTSALAFGTAVDKAIGALLDNKPENDPYATFEYFWDQQEINKVSEQLAESTKLVFSNNEFDYDLLSKEDKEYLEKRKNELGLEPVLSWLDCFEIILKKKTETGINSLKENEHKLLTLANWLSLRKKGLLMIDAFKEKVMPKIRQVLATQKEIKLVNDDGDEIIGFADLIAEVDGLGITVLDIKTSSILYDEQDSVIMSPQLSLYVHALEEEYMTRNAGFIVLQKRVKKNKKKTCSKCGIICNSKARSCDVEKDGIRCKGEFIEEIDPEILVQFITAEIPRQTEEIVLDNFSYINTAIKTGSYHRNLQSCVMSWGRCPYWNLCYKGDMSDLVKLEEKKNES